jgi:RHS repeat-associated protein
VWRWDQGEPFGNDVPNNNPSGAGAFDFPLRFPGQYFDRETNVAYNWRRHYDSGTGRYVESDPVGLVGGLSTYGYVLADPLGLADPSGLEPIPSNCELRSEYGQIYPYPWDEPEKATDLGFWFPTPDNVKAITCLLKKGTVPRSLGPILKCFVDTIHDTGVHLFRYDWVHHVSYYRNWRTYEWCYEGCPPEWKKIKLVGKGREKVGPDDEEARSRYEWDRVPGPPDNPFPF